MAKTSIVMSAAALVLLGQVNAATLVSCYLSGQSYNSNTATCSGTADIYSNAGNIQQTPGCN